MDGKSFLTEDSAYQNLLQYFNDTGKNLNINQLFAQDPDRFNKYRYLNAEYVRNIMLYHSYCFQQPQAIHP